MSLLRCYNTTDDEFYESRVGRKHDLDDNKSDHSEAGLNTILRTVGRARRRGVKCGSHDLTVYIDWPEILIMRFQVSGPLLNFDMTITSL